MGVMAEIIYKRGRGRADTEFGSLYVKGDDQAGNVARNGLRFEYELERFSCVPMKEDENKYGDFERRLVFLFGFGRENERAEEVLNGMRDKINRYTEKGLAAEVVFTSRGNVALELYCTERWKVMVK